MSPAESAPPVSPIVNAMTVDVEDYFQVSAFDRVVQRSDWDGYASRVVANTERLLDLFAAHGVKTTCFILGWVADRFPALVKTIAAAGHEIGSHGYGHRLITEQTPDAFREDIRRAKGVLESLAGVAVDGYRAPSFSITTRTLWALDVLIEEGHRYDASIFPIRHDRYGIPQAPRHAHVITRAAGTIVEAPASTVRAGGMNLPIAGGGYFRLLPYGWTRFGIRHLNRTERRPAIFYLHPWEIDPEQPRLPVRGLGRFRHYRHLAETHARLRRLLGDFQFAPLRSVLADLALATPAAPPARFQAVAAPR